MRKNIAAGNWKMNLDQNGAKALLADLSNAAAPDNAVVICGVPYIYLNEALSQTEGTHVNIAAQNCHHKTSGAYTVEISIDMLHSIGIKYVIIGHSERREYFSESNEMIKDKLNLILEKGITPIFCCGEPLEIREANAQNDFVLKQLQESLFHLDEESITKVIIAYEPIWAIGTGKTATPLQAQEMHAFIRAEISSQYDNDKANSISILYGGSVKPANAKELFANPDVDGGLVGGASLKSDSFLEIIASF